MPGSTISMLARSTPGALGAREGLLRARSRSRPSRRRRPARGASRRSSPRRCMSTAGTPRAATSGAIAGSNPKPLTSFTRSAPASRAARATSALRGVDRERPGAPAPQRLDHRGDAARLLRGRRPAPRRAASTRRRRPPCRRPSSNSAQPVRDGRVGARERPPSENESGVTLRTPMTSVRSPRTTLGARAAGCEYRRRPLRLDRVLRVGPRMSASDAPSAAAGARPVGSSSARCARARRRRPAAAAAGLHGRAARPRSAA